MYIIARDKRKEKKKKIVVQTTRKKYNHDHQSQRLKTKTILKLARYRSTFSKWITCFRMQITKLKNERKERM